MSQQSTQSDGMRATGRGTAEAPTAMATAVRRGNSATGGSTPMRGVFLEIENLRVTFDDFVAIDDASLSFYSGDLRFLIGPNGAGKTTLVDAITGLAPAKGRIEVSGQPILGTPTHKLARLGIGRTFQNASVFEELTVEQNMDIASGARRGWTTLLRRRRGMTSKVRDTLETVGLSAYADTKAGVLSHGQKQWLEIGMLLVQDCTVLLLDEPVAGMGKDERQATGRLLRKIAEDHAVIVVEHDMEFMREFATSVTVLAQGSVLAEGSVADIQSDPAVREVYLGTAEMENDR